MLRNTETTDFTSLCSKQKPNRFLSHFVVVVVSNTIYSSISFLSHESTDYSNFFSLRFRYKAIAHTKTFTLQKTEILCFAEPKKEIKIKIKISYN